MKSLAVLALLGTCAGPIGPVELPVPTAPAVLRVLVSMPDPYFACDGTVDLGALTAHFSCSVPTGSYSFDGTAEYLPLDDRAQLHIRALPADESHYFSNSDHLPLALDFTPTDDPQIFTGWGTIYPPDDFFGHPGAVALAFVQTHDLSF